MKSKKYIFPLVASILLVAFTAYIILDTFVIIKEYEPSEPINTWPPEESITTSDPPESSPAPESESDTTEETPTETPPESTEPEPEYPIITKNSYIDENISLVLETYRLFATDIHVVDVKLSHPRFLKTALAVGTETTSNLAVMNEGLLAVNGDFYSARSKGYVVRNGMIYRSVPDSGRDALAIFSDGSMEIVREDKTSLSSLMDRGAIHVLTFGPGLVENGEVIFDPSNSKYKGISVKNPRTAIGIIDDLHYVFISVDGRTDDSAGLTLSELAEVMVSLGVKTGYNLDGGGSATMYFMGKTINNPSDGSERRVRDIVYIGY